MYQIKTVFTGYKLGLKNTNLYVGIPSKYFTGPYLAAKCQNQFRLFKADKRIAERTFPDRFRPNETYTLYYFLWKKINKNKAYPSYSD
jgi:hypothetical protein